MAAGGGGWYDEAEKLCAEDDLMAALGDRSMFSLDDINLDDIFLDLKDTDIISGFAADNPPPPPPPHSSLFPSSVNLLGDSASSETAPPATVEVGSGSGGVVLPEGLLCEDIDVTQLEWLSNFCEESYSSSSDGLHFLPFHVDPGDVVGDNRNQEVAAAAADSAKEQLVQFRTSSPISVLEHQGLGAGAPQPTSSSTSSLSSPTSSACSGIGGSGGKVITTAAPLRSPPPEPMVIPARCRSKRPRPASFSPRPPILIPFPPSNSEAAAPTSPTSSHIIEPASHAAAFQWEMDVGPMEQKKKKKKKAKKAPPPSAAEGGVGDDEEEEEEEAAVSSSSSSSSSGVVMVTRKCMHCEVTKTPQWRAGPMGPKTLCNACGVRYKSGRLFPEYRPAASPTFVVSAHSNSHKKVVEMRNTKVTPNHDVTTTERPHDVASKACELLDYIRTRHWCDRHGHPPRTPISSSSH